MALLSEERCSPLVVGEHSLTLLDHRSHARPHKMQAFHGFPIKFLTAEVNPAWKFLASSE
jgi:hypothetical protein